MNKRCEKHKERKPMQPRLDWVSHQKGDTGKGKREGVGVETTLKGAERGGCPWANMAGQEGGKGQ